MKENIKDLILGASSRMTETAFSTPYIISKGGKKLPDRGNVIRIIKEIRRVMFPGYFGDENISVISPKYFIGDRLTHIYGNLKKEVKAALDFRSQVECGEDELDKKAENMCRRLCERLPDV